MAVVSGQLVLIGIRTRNLPATTDKLVVAGLFICNCVTHKNNMWCCYLDIICCNSDIKHNCYNITYRNSDMTNMHIYEIHYISTDNTVYP